MKSFELPSPALRERTSELDRILERMRQNRAARRTSEDIPRSTAVSPEQRMGSTVLAGARVFDLVSGLEGEVIAATRENVIVPTTK